MTRGLLCLVATALTLTAQSAWSQPAPIHLTVTDAVSRAFEASHRLAEARARQDGAEAAVRLRQTADRPTASGSAGYSRTNHVDVFGFPQPDAGFHVFYPDIPTTLALSVDGPSIRPGGATRSGARRAPKRAPSGSTSTQRQPTAARNLRALWAVATARRRSRHQESVAGGRTGERRAAAAGRRPRPAERWLG
jgi:outer membrane protein TolC